MRTCTCSVLAARQAAAAAAAAAEAAAASRPSPPPLSEERSFSEDMQSGLFDIQMLASLY